MQYATFICNHLKWITFSEHQGFDYYQCLVNHSALTLLYTPPPLKWSFNGVYCFQHVRDSENPKFCQHLKLLLYNFDSFCPICSNLHHALTIRQCMFGRKVGAEGSVLQELCHFKILIIRCIITDSTYFVKLVFAL